MRRCPILFAFLLTLTALVARAENTSFTVEVELAGKRLEGTPLAWSASDVFLLSRDGHLFNFHPDDARSFRKTSDHFVSFTPNDVRRQLQTEFGRAFDVTSTGHYLVVHPRGERDQWARRFEELYRAFLRYFAARGLNPQPPVFPLVAVVFRNQADFDRFARESGAKIPTGTLGYYSPQSNRVLLYDVTAGNPDDPNWQMNAETIVHEAIHQMAFNSGIHSRFAPPPRWVAEGLGTFFEARGVSNADRFAEQSERINRYRLEDFRKYVARRRPTGALPQFISADRGFLHDPENAYAEAWALTFFLLETQPQRYVRYLQKTASRPDFVEYTGPQRLADFEEAFGQNLRQLESRYLRFMSALP